MHELKTWPAFFQAVVSGRKLFEVRKDDRDYKVGDALHLREWDEAAQLYTGRSHRVLVTYILRGFGVSDGYCAMTIVDADQAA